jgi:RHS repeat-associated protein
LQPPYNTQVIQRRAAVPVVLRALVALAGALVPASAWASLPSLSDVVRIDEQQLSAPRELATDMERAIPEPCAGAFCAERAQPKTRVWGFALGVQCHVGGEAGLTCGARRAYGRGDGERASGHSVFTGHYFDSETNLYYAKARYLDPEFGRFITQDSYLGKFDQPPSLHRYSYGWNRPTFWTDPTGHAPMKEEDARTLAYFMENFTEALVALPGNIGRGLLSLATPGAASNKGAVAQKQRETLAHASDPTLDPITRGATYFDALSQQPTVIVEETIIQPILRVPANSRKLGTELAEAGQATNWVDRTLHRLEAVKSLTDAFSALATPAAMATAPGRRAVASRAAAAGVEGELPQTVSVFRKMSAAEAETTLETMRLQGQVPGSNSSKYLSESLEKVQAFQNKGVPAGTKEEIVEFVLDREGYQRLMSTAVDQTQSKGVDALKYNLEGIPRTSLGAQPRNIGVPASKMEEFNQLVLGVQRVQAQR